MAKLTEYSATTRLPANDILIEDGTGGTHKITAADAAIELAGLISSVNHRNVFRGKNLGTSITEAQKAAIRAGTFDDLFIGDYWTLGGTTYRIADMDYWLHCGDTEFTKHHLVMVPDTNMYNAKMNETNSTEGGYMGSDMYTTHLEQAKTTINAAFGDMVQSHREILTNAVTDGHASGYAWADSTVDLMNEIMVYGCHIYAAMGDGATVPVMYTINNSQLAIFRLNPNMYKKRIWFWLRDVVSAAYFALVDHYGDADAPSASYSRGVRPVFAIG